MAWRDFVLHEITQCLLLFSLTSSTSLYRPTSWTFGSRNGSNRVSCFLHRLRQPTGWQRWQTKRHFNLPGLRSFMQRYAGGLIVCCMLSRKYDELMPCTDTSSKTIITRSKPTAFPSALRAKRSEVQTINEADMQTHAVISERCEKCGREEVRFYTQQLRSADEGSTVFYECECGNK